MEHALTLKKDAAVSAPPLFLLMLLIALPQLSEALFSPALPAITVELNTTASLIQWSIGVYFLGFAFGALFWGKLSDHIGRRPCILAGLLFYTCMSFACNNANTITYLLIARLFQGLGIGISGTVIYTVIRDCYTNTESARIFFLVCTTISFAPALGPIIGGFLTATPLSWHATFICLTFCGLSLLIVAGLYFPETKLVVLDDDNFDPPPSFLTVFKKMLADHQVIAFSLMIGGFNAILYSFYAKAPYLFINNLHFSSLHYGIVGLFIAAGMFVGSLLSQHVDHGLTAGKLIHAVCYLMSVLFIIFAILAIFRVLSLKNPHGIFMMMCLMMLFAVCYGVAVPNVLNKALNQYLHCIGNAGAIFGFLSFFWVALFMFVLGSFQSLYLIPSFFLSISLMISISAFLCRE